MHAPGRPVEGRKTPQGWVLPSPELVPSPGGGVPSAKQEEWMPAHGARPIACPELQNGGDAAGLHLSTPDRKRKPHQDQTVKQSDRCAFVYTSLCKHCPA